MGPRQQHHKNGNSTSRRWPTTKRNREERIKPGELIDALKELFSEYGEIIDVVAKTNLKAKGQAFVVFDNVESAQKCIEDVQGFDLFGKPMQLAFAKTRSDAFVKRTAGDEELESHKRRRLAEKDKKKAAEQAEEPQAYCSRGNGPRWRRKTYQSYPWCWSQVYKCWCRCCHPRRVLASQ